VPRASPDEHPATLWTATGLEPQIFLDQTGRRARVVRLAGALAAMLGAAWLAALVTGALGFSNLPRLPGPIGILATTPVHLIHVADHREHRRLLETAAAKGQSGLSRVGGSRA
jgi:hypothetical protein